jgi:hypothetical protein
MEVRTVEKKDKDTIRDTAAQLAKEQSNFNQIVQEIGRRATVLQEFMKRRSPTDQRAVALFVQMQSAIDGLTAKAVLSTCPILLDRAELRALLRIAIEAYEKYLKMLLNMHKHLGGRSRPETGEYCIEEDIKEVRAALEKFSAMQLKHGLNGD